jgi:hypothetical protein
MSRLERPGGSLLRQAESALSAIAPDLLCTIDAMGRAQPLFARRFTRLFLLASILP